MKNEPLNLKEIKKLIEECAKNYEIFGDALIDATFIDIRNHLKSAVSGLLKEIENTDLLVLEELDFIDRNNLDPEEIVVNTLEYVKWLIKKSFPDVVEE